MAELRLDLVKTYETMMEEKRRLDREGAFLYSTSEGKPMTSREDLLRHVMPEFNERRIQYVEDLIRLRDSLNGDIYEALDNVEMYEEAEEIRTIRNILAVAVKRETGVLEYPRIQ